MTSQQTHLFRIIFHDGHIITTTATSSLIAEAKACRQHAGFVRKVEFIRKVSQ